MRAGHDAGVMAGAYGRGRDAWMRRGPVNRFRFANVQWLQTAASGSSSGL